VGIEFHLIFWFRFLPISPDFLAGTDFHLILEVVGVLLHDGEHVVEDVGFPGVNVVNVNIFSKNLAFLTQDTAILAQK
jgi:hypothetical protein